MKPASVHLIDGTYNVTKHKEKLEREQHNAALMPPSRPTPLDTVKLYPDAVKRFEYLCTLLPWLTGADSVALSQYVMLIEQWEESPTDFSASHLAQMRKIECDLGMTISARAKFDVPKAAEKSRFFDD